MTLKNKLIYLIIVLFFFGCSEHKNLNRILTNGESKKWILDEYTSMYGENRKLNIRVIEFKNDSSFFTYKYNDGLISLIENKNSDIILTNKWFFKNDTLISINHSDYKIIKLKQDTLLIKNIADNTKFLYKAYKRK